MYFTGLSVGKKGGGGVKPPSVTFVCKVRHITVTLFFFSRFLISLSLPTFNLLSTLPAGT